MDEKAADDLVPLELAVQAIYARVYEAEQRKPDLEQLNAIAHAIAALLPVFTYDKARPSVRRLSEQELQQGLFKQGGRTMVFPDGRTPIQNLAASNEALDIVVRELSGKSS